MNKKMKTGLISTSLFLLLTGCTGTNQTNNNAELTSIDLVPILSTIDDFDQKGASVTVIADYSNGTRCDVTNGCTFTTLDEDIAYVSSNYIYSGDEEGKTTITAQYKEDGKTMTDTSIVTVVNDEESIKEPEA